MSEKKPPTRHRGQTKCFLCEEFMRSDLLIRHMLRHKDDLPHLLHPNCRRAAIEQKIPMMFYHSDFLSRKEYTQNKNNLFCVCLICKKGKYAKGHGNVEDFYRLHKDTNCMRQWDSVADLFGDVDNTPVYGNIIYTPVSVRVASLEQQLAEQKQSYEAKIEEMREYIAYSAEEIQSLEDRLKSSDPKK